MQNTVRLLAAVLSLVGQMASASAANAQEATYRARTGEKLTFLVEGEKVTLDVSSMDVTFPGKQCAGGASFRCVSVLFVDFALPSGATGATRTWSYGGFDYEVVSGSLAPNDLAVISARSSGPQALSIRYVFSWRDGVVAFAGTAEKHKGWLDRGPFILDGGAGLLADRPPS